MTTRARTLVGVFPHVAALLVIFADMGFSAPEALAQGSFVVTITSPAHNSTVAGTITVKATVSLAGAPGVGRRGRRSSVQARRREFGPGRYQRSVRGSLGHDHH